MNLSQNNAWGNQRSVCGPFDQMIQVSSEAIQILSNYPKAILISKQLLALLGY